MKDEKYTYDDLLRHYNEDYIDFTLRKALQAKLLCARFIPIKDLNIRPSATRKAWKFYDKDPYLFDRYKEDKYGLGRDIIKNGTYWALFINNPNANDKIYVLDGNHRIVSLKFLVQKGELSEDFKMLCIWENIDKNIVEIPPISIRYLIGMKYRYSLYDSFYENGHIRKEIYYDIISSGGKFVNYNTIEQTFSNPKDVLYYTYEYGFYLKDFFYNMIPEIPKSKIINDEKYFREWLKCYDILEG